MKKRRTSLIPKNLQKKIIPLKATIFWNFVDCIQLASKGFKYQFLPSLPYNNVFFECDFIFNLLMEERSKKLQKITIGSLIGCVFTSKHNLFFPIMQKHVEIQNSKIRTFVGHVIQCRLKEKNTSLLLRVCLAGEFFFFRIYPYAPNILSFYTITAYKGNYRSSFKFKVKMQRRGLRKSRTGNV